MTDQVDSANLRDLSLLSLTAAQAGAHAIRRQSGEGISIDTKAHEADFVTSADLAADRAITGVLAVARPADGILSEESGEHPGTSGVRWLVDPLDGTANFVYGRQDYAVSVGVEYDGAYVVGAVACPVTGDWVAAGGGEVRSSGRTHKITDRPLRESVIGFGYPGTREHRARAHAQLGELLGEIRDHRRLGSAAIDLMLVALGQQEGAISFGVNPWDVAAGAAAVAEAGGRSAWVDTASGITAYVSGTPTAFERLSVLAREV